MFVSEFRIDGASQIVYNRFHSPFGAAPNSAYQILRGEVNPMTQLINVKELLSSEPSAASSQMVLPYYTPTDSNDRTLVFESRFESGNLAMAIKVSDAEYNLVLSNDINTKGHT